MTRTRIPPPLEDAKFCPLIAQGCVGDACAFWVQMWGHDPDTGEPAVHEECSIPGLVILQRETVIEVARAAASSDKAANETARLTTLAAAGRSVPSGDRMAIGS